MELVFVSCAQFNITNTSYVVITEFVSLGCHEYWWNWDTDFVDYFFKVFKGCDLRSCFSSEHCFLKVLTSFNSEVE